MAYGSKTPAKKAKKKSSSKSPKVPMRPFTWPNPGKSLPGGK